MAKFDYSYEHHLAVKEFSLRPGEEKGLQLHGWSMVLVKEGTVYWLDKQKNQQVDSGAVLFLKQGVEGTILASQLGGATLQVFRVEPQRLTGLITLHEQRWFETETHNKDFSPRLFPAQSEVATKLRELCSNPNRHALPYRLQLLQVFFEAFGTEFCQNGSEPVAQPGAQERLRKLLEQMPAAEMLEMRFSYLVQQTMCTPRHLNRIFHEVVGKSFREMQTELRLFRACELLATTQSKVLEVAMESGYQSLSLFNLIFKRRFGVTPGSWRENNRGQPIATRRARRTLRLKL